VERLLKKPMPYIFPYKPTLLANASPSLESRYYVLDTNILNYAVTSIDGEVIKRINEGLDRIGVDRYPGKMGFCTTPFQLLESLGVVVPEISVKPSFTKGESPEDVMWRVIEEARHAYSSVECIQKPWLERRAEERRSSNGGVKCDDHNCTTMPLPILRALLAWNTRSKVRIARQSTRTQTRLG
jgi:hypothetical protein